MKIATILPQPYICLTQDDDYFMALAHLINKPGMELYTNFFKQKSLDPKNYIIMDNGLIEGAPQPIEAMLYLSKEIGADELILPDVFTNQKETMLAVQDACEHLVLHGYGNLKLMAVPQGKTLEEWVECAAAFVNEPMINCLGIPKVLVNILGRDGRFMAIAELMEKVGSLHGKELHLLGCWKSDLEITLLAKATQQGLIPEIRGVDSALAYVYARANVKLHDDDRPDSTPIDFEQGYVQDLELLRHNIALWRDSANIERTKNICRFSCKFTDEED